MIVIGSTCEDKSSSSLLSDCTSGLVGGFKTKLDEYDEDKEGARERALLIESSPSAGGNRGSSWYGVKCRGGEVEVQGVSKWLYRFEFVCSRSPPGVDSRASVKSPLCKADRGLSICRPA